LFDKDHLQDITLEMTDDDLKEKYDNKLQKNMTGATFEVVSRLMKAVTGRKITVPGSYKSAQGKKQIYFSFCYIFRRRYLFHI
jgi:structure-specific recognition protein 1